MSFWDDFITTGRKGVGFVVGEHERYALAKRDAVAPPITARSMMHTGTAPDECRLSEAERRELDVARALELADDDEEERSPRGEREHADEDRDEDKDRDEDEDEDEGDRS